MKLRRAAIALALLVAALVTAAIAVGASSDSTQAPVGSGKASAKKSVCGMGTGKKATGRPIKMGGIFMLIPGVDFTTIGKLAKAYFDCVNDNGGIRGRPISFKLYTEQLQPGTGSRARPEARRERQGRRSRREHELRRVRRQREVLEARRDEHHQRWCAR